MSLFKSSTLEDANEKVTRSAIQLSSLLSHCQQQSEYVKCGSSGDEERDVRKCVDETAVFEVTTLFNRARSFAALHGGLFKGWAYLHA